MRQIVAFGGGGFSMEPGNTLLDDHVLELTGKERPRVCFLPTASGDADHYVVRFYRTFDSARCEPSHVSLFRRDQGPGEMHEQLLAADLIYVGGGSVVSLLGAWRAHGLDATLREAWERGTILCGLSAGSLCWFAEAVTAFHGPARAVRGLGLLPFSNCVHFEAEPSNERRARGAREPSISPRRARGAREPSISRSGAYRRLLAEGMVEGYATEDGAALHFEDDRLARVISSRPGARAYRMRWTGTRVSRRPLDAEYLGAPAALRAA